ncbi:MAG: LuxR family transcriptional regulator [Caulobacter sp.]|nr:LuxR family transcriptional regulator [Caulobacter sp.]
MYDVLSEEIDADGVARMIAEATDCPWAAVAVETPDGQTRVVSNAVFSGLPDLYAGDYGDTDPWRLRRPRTYDAAIVTDSFLAEADWRGSSFFNEVLRPHRIDPGRSMVAAVRLEGGAEAVVGVGRPGEAGAFSEAQQASLTSALPHLRRVLKLKSRLDQAQVSSAFADAALDAFPMAIFRITAGGMVCSQNRHGGGLLERADGLTVRGGRLVATHEASDLELQAGIYHALHRSGSVASMVSVRKPDDGYLSLMVSPISRRGESQVLIIAYGPQFDGGARRSRLSTLFRLSSAELDLSMGLLEGRTLSEIAAVRGVAVNTLRVQLRSILKKTGTSRQAELVALLARLPIMQSDA